MYALFTRNQDLVIEQCLIDSHIRHAYLALNLDGYIWAVSSLASNRIQVHCLEETHLEPIAPPLTVIYIGNGWEGYSINIYIPSKTDLTGNMDTSSRHNFFVAFNVIYQNVMWYGMSLNWKHLHQNKDLLAVKLSEFPLMTLNDLGKRIKKIRTSYLWSIPLYVILTGLVSYAMVGCTALVFSLWYIR